MIHPRARRPIYARDTTESQYTIDSMLYHARARVKKDPAYAILNAPMHCAAIPQSPNAIDSMISLRTRESRHPPYATQYSMHQSTARARVNTISQSHIIHTPARTLIAHYALSYKILYKIIYEARGIRTHTVYDTRRARAYHQYHTYATHNSVNI